MEEPDVEDSANSEEVSKGRGVLVLLAQAIVHLRTRHLANNVPWGLLAPDPTSLAVS